MRPTEPQMQGWPLIRTGADVLISAPTGSGKTLAAFLICLDALVREARTGTLANEIRVVYVSPLKALSNDVHKNLEAPSGRDSRTGGAARRDAGADPNRRAHRRYARVRNGSRWARHRRTFW